MKNLVKDFVVGVSTDYDKIELTKLLTERLSRELWGSFIIGISEIDEEDDVEFNFNIHCQAKGEYVPEDDPSELFILIKDIFTTQGFGVDKYPFK